MLRIEVVERDGALGAAALQDGREVGRLLARPRDHEIRGRHVRAGLDDHGLADAPVWSGVALPSEEELRSGWAEFLSEPGTTLFHRLVRVVSP
jgi:hypothetical protein